MVGGLQGSGGVANAHPNQGLRPNCSQAFLPEPEGEMGLYFKYRFCGKNCPVFSVLRTANLIFSLVGYTKKTWFQKRLVAVPATPWEGESVIMSHNLIVVSTLNTVWSLHCVPIWSLHCVPIFQKMTCLQTCLGGARAPVRDNASNPSGDLLRQPCQAIVVGILIERDQEVQARRHCGVKSRVRIRG